MKPNENVKLLKVDYFKDYKFSFEFNDGIVSVVDFKPIISYGTSLLEFMDIEKFKKINFDEWGDIWWGEDYDMCFHIDSYYKENQVNHKKKVGRKLINPIDKKIPVRIMVKQSIINEHGGMDSIKNYLSSKL